MQPWECKKTEFFADASRLDLWIDFAPESRFDCPECAAEGQPVHDTVDKEWRHMDFFQHMCYLHARVPRVRCDACGVHLVTVPWARPGSGFTLLFEALAMSMAPHMPVDDIARQLRIHDTRLWRILQFHITRAREREDYSAVQCIAIDETSRRRGHRYVSIVTDADARRVLFACEGRGQDVLGRFADGFHTHGDDPDRIREISMDMSPAFIAGVREVLPNAHMTFDRFHIMKLANEALDAVRREEAKENPHLKGSRFLGLRHPHQLSATQAQTLSDLRYCTHKTNNAYTLFVGLRMFFDMEAKYAKSFSSGGITGPGAVGSSRSKRLRSRSNGTGMASFVFTSHA